MGSGLCDAQRANQVAQRAIMGLFKVGSSNVDRGPRTKVIEVVIYPRLRSFPPQGAELPEEPDICVEFTRGPESTHGASRSGATQTPLCDALEEK
jgi:hypothetical protein